MDDHILQFTAKRFNTCFDEVMCQRALGDFSAHTAVDTRCFEQADQNRKRAISFNFTQKDDLLIVDLADDDSSQFHLDKHGKPLAVFER